MSEIVLLIVQELKRAGTKPFIIPAMGSHGSATAEGQVALLAGYGVTEARMGVPIRPSMEVKKLGKLSFGVIKAEEANIEKFCDGDFCDVEITPTTGDNDDQNYAN